MNKTVISRSEAVLSTAHATDELLSADPCLTDVRLQAGRGHGYGDR